MKRWPGAGMTSAAALMIALGAAAVGFAPMSCVLDTSGTAPPPAAPGDPGTGGAGAGMTSGGQGGGPLGQEDCLDGIDNDGDTLVDCADTDDCAAEAYECVDAAPAGWTAGVRAAKAPYPSNGALPACPEGMAQADYFAGPAQTADCTPCNCTLSGAACSAPDIACYWGNGSCDGLVDFAENDILGGLCYTFTLPPSSGSCRLVGPPAVLNSGACTFGAGDGQLVEPSWTDEIRVCTGAVGGGCGDARVCVPKAPPGSGVEGASCITREGSEACPSGWTSETQLYQGGSDDRACSACACDMNTMSCMGGGWEAFEYNYCQIVTPLDKTSVGTSCQSVTQFLGQQFSLGTIAATPTPPQCSSQGSGSVTPEGPVKLCCKAQP